MFAAFYSNFKFYIMRNLLFGFLFIPLFASAQLQKFEFQKVSENELMAITWIVEDSIVSHDKVLVLPLSATNQNLNGCMCAVKTDSLRQKAAIICLLTKGKTFRELSSQKEKDLISATKKDFAFSIKSDDPGLFWWSIE